MNTKYDVGDEVLIKGKVKAINVGKNNKAVYSVDVKQVSDRYLRIEECDIAGKEELTESLSPKGSIEMPEEIICNCTEGEE